MLFNISISFIKQFFVGVKDFWQVKFTPSPHKDENRLSWDWLLKVSGKTERSRSIFKKLYDAIVSVPSENLGDVVLLTNNSTPA
jgi:hypothetical protein